MLLGTCERHDPTARALPGIRGFLPGDIGARSTQASGKWRILIFRRLGSMSSNSDSATPRARAQPPFRADHVGSFLRPKALLEARDRHKAGAIGAQELRVVEDDAIRQIVRFQEDLGLRSITDGEFRRYSFHTDFLVQLGGVVRTGRIAGRTTQVTQGKTELAPPVLQVDAPVRHIKPILRGDFEFVASLSRVVSAACSCVMLNSPHTRRTISLSISTPNTKAIC
jgi:methionine synthase II (cobalamin-independent)